MRAFIILAAAALATGSCVREDLAAECDGQVLIAVRDKNYDNAAVVGDVVMDENLPMRDYIGSLVTQEHVRTSEVYNSYEESLPDVVTNFAVPPAHISHGVNELSMVGRSLATAMLDAEGELSHTLTLHPDNEQGEDIYLGGDVVKFPRQDDAVVWMMRTKGKLMVDVVNAPATANRIQLSVGSLFATVSEELSGDTADDIARITYGGTTDVSRFYPSQGATGTYHLKLAPSATATSPLKITFLDASDEILFELSTDITIARNHITRIKAEYAEDRKLWTITVNVDGRWTNVENMTIS